MNYISTEDLTGGEKIALSILEITALPHISIIDDRLNAIEDTLTRYKTEFGGLLNEIYQSYKSMSVAAGYSKDISIELLWKTTKVMN